MSQPPLKRGEVRSLLAHYRLAGPGPVTDEQVSTWLRELRGYSAGECHAALAAMEPHRVGTPTAAEITERIDAARANPAGAPAPRVPGQRDRAAERARAAKAGARGIRAVYAAMGWARNVEHDHARTVPCPFCKASRGQTCGPLVRNRHGQREDRDRVTRMHPSRLAAATTTTNDSALAEAR